MISFRINTHKLFSICYHVVRVEPQYEQAIIRFRWKKESLLSALPNPFSHMVSSFLSLPCFSLQMLSASFPCHVSGAWPCVCADRPCSVLTPNDCRTHKDKTERYVAWTGQRGDDFKSRVVWPRHIGNLPLHIQRISAVLIWICDSWLLCLFPSHPLSLCLLRLSPSFLH